MRPTRSERPGPSRSVSSARQERSPDMRLLLGATAPSGNLRVTKTTTGVPRLAFGLGASGRIVEVPGREPVRIPFEGWACDVLGHAVPADRVVGEVRAEVELAELDDSHQLG